MQALLIQILELIGAEVRAVGRGDDALAEIQKEIPTLVVLDVDLPGNINGLDVLQSIRADAKTAKVRVILVTAQHVAARTIEAEASDLVLLKPIDPEQLILLVERLLKSSEGGM